MSSVRRSGGEKHAQPLLVVLCGPSHAGKSTFAERHCKGFAVVSSDRIRGGLGMRFGDSRREARVWEAFDRRKREALRAGRDVVLDACHLSPEARRHAVEGPNGRHRKVFILFDLPLETILARCRRTGRLALDEAERMWRAFQANKPTAEELRRLGFDEVHVLRGGGRRRLPLGREPVRRAMRRRRTRAKPPGVTVPWGNGSAAPGAGGDAAFLQPVT